MKLRRIALPVAAALIAVMALAPGAHAAEPKPGYTQFAGCPSHAENPTIVYCLRSVIKGGHFQMGNKDVPITNPMTLSGGLAESGLILATSKGGLTPAKQKVPGGVVGLTGLTWLLEILGSEALTLYAVTELAGQPSFNPEGDGTYNLPVKVHLINSTLGNKCYVGSVSNPIKLGLTPGTTNPPPPNVPITGSKGEIAFDSTLNIIHQNNMELVDNSFAAPGASGCVLTLFGFIPISINGLVNLQSGLPAAAGTNETRQIADSELTAASNVYP